MPDLTLVETQPRNRTRAVRVGRLIIGGGAPIAVQSMAATRCRTGGIFRISEPNLPGKSFPSGSHSNDFLQVTSPT